MQHDQALLQYLLMIMSNLTRWYTDDKWLPWLFSGYSIQYWGIWYLGLEWVITKVVNIMSSWAWSSIQATSVIINPVSIQLTFPAAVDCGTLTDPLNGQVTLTATTFMSTATYSCNSGYTLSGSTTRTCEANGTWSDTAPTCDRKYKVQITRAIN